MKRLFRTHYRDYQLNQPATIKMDESEGICRDDVSHNSCWGRICNPNRGHVLKDILRGLLVLIVLAIVVTVIFLLCYFLLNDIEKKEDEVIDNLVKDFSAGGPLPPIPEILSKDINQNSPSDTELYDSGPSSRGDLGKEKEKIQIADPNNNNFRTQGSGKFPAVTVFVPSSPSLSNNGENVKVVKPPFLIPEVHATTEEVPEERIPLQEAPVEQQWFIPVRSSPPSEGVLGSNFNQDADGQNFDNFSDFVVAESGSECVPLRLPLCTTMPWTLTSFPNWVNNNNMKELQESLKYFQSTIIGGRCSAKATEYSCAILEPACGPDGIPLPPCKAFCEDISRTCSEYLTKENKHRIALQCDRFPDSKNPNVCVDVIRAERFDSKMTDVKSTLSHKTTFDRPDVNQPPFKDYPNVPENHSNDDYLSDTYDEVSGREDLMSSTSIDPTSSDIAKIIDFADIPKEIKKIQDLQTFTPNKNVGEKVRTAAFEITPENSDSETTELPVFICDHTKFLCEDGSDCLPPEAVCDGTQNCLDNSDEANCTAPDCKDDSFSCASTSYCIPRSWMCDGTDDCKDNSDELNCPTNSTTNFDDFANNRDGDNLVAESSDLLPGVFGVIDDGVGDSAGSSNILTNDGSSPPDKDINISSRLPVPFNANYPPEDDVTAEILSQFPKFGTESEPNFGFENVDKVITENIHTEDNTDEMKTVSSETPQEDAHGQLKRNRPDRFKISRPSTRFSIERQQSFEIRNPAQAERNPGVPSLEGQENGNGELAEDSVAEEPKETEPASPVRRRQRPPGLRIPSRRGNQGLRRPINSPDEAPASTEESTPEPANPMRQNKRPTTPSYESFRTRSTLPPVSPPGKRPTSIVMRRPTGDSAPTPTLAEKVDEFLKESEPTNSQSLPSAAQPITIPKQILPQITERSENIENQPNAPRRTRLRPSRPERPFLPGGKLNRERNQLPHSSSSEPTDLLVEGSETVKEYVYPDVEPSESSRVDDTYNDDQNKAMQESEYYSQDGTDEQNYFQKEDTPEYLQTQEAFAEDASSPNSGSATDEYAYDQFSRKPAPENRFAPESYQPERTNLEAKYQNEPAYAAAANVPLFNFPIPNNPEFSKNRRNDYQSPYDNSPLNYYQNSEQPLADSEDIEEAASDVSPYYNVRNNQPQQTFQEVPNYSQQTYKRSNEPIYQYADPQSPHLLYRIHPNYRQAYPNSH